LVVAEGLAAPTQVALSPDYAYVVTDDGLVRIPRTGGAPVPMAKVSNAALLAADETGVYWYDGATISTAAMPGQTPIVLAPTGWLGQDVLLDATYVYWSTSFDQYTTPDGGTVFDNGGVWRVPKAGGTPELVGPSSQAILGGPRFATKNGFVAYVDGTKIRAVGPDAGAPAVIAQQSPTVATITADAVSLYWIAGPVPSWNWCLGGGGCPSSGPPPPPVPNGIFEVPWGGGTVSTISAEGDLTELQASGTSLFGLGFDSASQDVTTRLVRVDIGLGTRTLFAAGGTIGGFAVDGQRVFWTRGEKLLSAPAQ
jgi:hypothetical protein